MPDTVRWRTRRIVSGIVEERPPSLLSLSFTLGTKNRSILEQRHPKFKSVATCLKMRVPWRSYAQPKGFIQARPSQLAQHRATIGPRNHFTRGPNQSRHFDRTQAIGQLFLHCRLSRPLGFAKGGYGQETRIAGGFFGCALFMASSTVTASESVTSRHAHISCYPPS
ncbi:hypothetical protein QBC32DRAFT_6396 [Pseudoneurospora amorphoporcata]|uniref:Uncharacterized protein n=1 Tax=Pseudoneurospora amorphoporcata TaxID=241081 RepID=A0AAN6NRQ6_9PEZI|nr:hypothetical protein QBC32DRAFT_6396 [Pseudoneurospora amorphoporcata]